MKIFKMNILYISVVLLIFINAAGSAQTISMKNGVRSVENNELTKEKQFIEIELINKIGEKESENDNLNLYQIADVFQDKDENIYILDSGNFRIQKFDKNGNYVTSIGKKGQGPGEFSSTYGMTYNPASIDAFEESGFWV